MCTQVQIRSYGCVCAQVINSGVSPVNKDTVGSLSFSKHSAAVAAAAAAASAAAATSAVKTIRYVVK